MGPTCAPRPPRPPQPVPGPWVPHPVPQGGASPRVWAGLGRWSWEGLVPRRKFPETLGFIHKPTASPASLPLCVGVLVLMQKDLFSQGDLSSLPTGAPLAPS